MLSAIPSRLHLVHDWWIAHPGWVSFIYFLIAIWISLFTAKAKEFVILPFRASASWMKLSARRDLQSHLNTIKFIHNDPFKLVLYVAYGVVDGIVWSGVIAGLYSFATIIIGLTMHSKEVLALNSYSIFVGGIIGRAILIRQNLRYLYNYDQSVKSLETALATVSEPHELFEHALPSPPEGK